MTPIEFAVKQGALWPNSKCGWEGFKRPVVLLCVVVAVSAVNHRDPRSCSRRQRRPRGCPRIAHRQLMPSELLQTALDRESKTMEMEVPEGG
jgi:hypothetical protein